MKSADTEEMNVFGTIKFLGCLGGVRVLW